MAQLAIGMIETKGLVALVQATDAALKAADVAYKGWKKVGSGLCSVFVDGRRRRGEGRGRRRRRGGPRDRRGRQRARDPAAARRGQRGDSQAK